MKNNLNGFSAPCSPDRQGRFTSAYAASAASQPEPGFEDVTVPGLIYTVDASGRWSARSINR